jgi:threonine/homoserine/homoserine lactone efflux protein
MAFHQWLFFLLVISVLIAVPGPSAILCMTHGAKYGAKKSIGTVLGGMLAALTLMFLSALGVGAILQASSTLFLLLKLVGAAYLIYLGINTWRTAPLQMVDQSDHDAQNQVLVSFRHCFFRHCFFRHCFLRGFIVGIGNPKDLLFFGALFPQFIDTTSSIASQFLILALTWSIVDSLFMFSYVLAGKKISSFLARLGGGKLFHRLTGSVFIFAGGALVSASR